MRRQGRHLAAWAAMMMLCYAAESGAAEGGILPLDLKPMLEHAAIALLAWFTLDGNFLLIVLIILGGLALKTYLHILREP